MGSRKIPQPDIRQIEAIDRDTMRQAITTTFHGPTDRRGSRIIARCEAGSGLGDHEGDWWETEAICPAVADCRPRNGIGAKDHLTQWCQWCGRQAGEE